MSWNEPPTASIEIEEAVTCPRFVQPTQLLPYHWTVYNCIKPDARFDQLRFDYNQIWSTSGKPFARQFSFESQYLPSVIQIFKTV